MNAIIETHFTAKYRHNGTGQIRSFFNIQTCILFTENRTFTRCMVELTPKSRNFEMLQLLPNIVLY